MFNKAINISSAHSAFATCKAHQCLNQCNLRQARALAATAASSFLAADSLGIAQIELCVCRCASCGDCPVFHTLIKDRLHQRQEGVLHALTPLCRSLAEQHPLLVGKRLGYGGFYDSLVVHVGFVANEQLCDVATRISLDLVEPHFGVVERNGVRNIVHDNDAVCSSVVATRNRPEAFLPSSIPNLHFYSFPLDVYISYLEVYSNCADESLLEHVIGETKQQGRFADPAVPH